MKTSEEEEEGGGEEGVRSDVDCAQARETYPELAQIEGGWEERVRARTALFLSLDLLAHDEEARGSVPPPLPPWYGRTLPPSLGGAFDASLSWKKNGG